jgi:hypothetical protein
MKQIYYENKFCGESIKFLVSIFFLVYQLSSWLILYCQIYIMIHTLEIFSCKLDCN